MPSPRPLGLPACLAVSAPGRTRSSRAASLALDFPGASWGSMAEEGPPFAPRSGADPQVALSTVPVPSEGGLHALSQPGEPWPLSVGTLGSRLWCWLLACLLRASSLSPSLWCAGPSLPCRHRCSGEAVSQRLGALSHVSCSSEFLGVSTLLGAPWRHWGQRADQGPRRLAPLPAFVLLILTSPKRQEDNKSLLSCTPDLETTQPLSSCSLWGWRG